MFQKYCFRSRILNKRAKTIECAFLKHTVLNPIIHVSLKYSKYFKCSKSKYSKYSKYPTDFYEPNLFLIYALY